MRTLKRLCLLFVCIFAVFTAMKAGPVDDNGLLQVKGSQLCSADTSPNGGNAIQLKGMSLFWSQYGQLFWNESAVDLSADWLGCQIIRAPVGVGDKDVLEMPGGYIGNEQVNIDRVKTVVDEAINYKNIYVIIDWHDSNAQVANHTTASMAFFKKMAEKYGNVPNVIFEIFNEPTGDGGKAGPAVPWETIKTYSRTIIDAIRGTNGVDGKPTKNLIVVGTPNWSALTAEVISSPLEFTYTNIAYALHFYAASSSHQCKDDTTGQLKGMGLALKNAMDQGLCVFVTEWGTVDYNGQNAPDQKHSQDWVSLMEQYKVSWCNWTLNDKSDAGETDSMIVAGRTPLGPWTDNDLTASGKMVKAWFVPPTTPFVVSPSLINFTCHGGSNKIIKPITGKLTGVDTSGIPSWSTVTVDVVNQTITVGANAYDSKTDNRTFNLTVNDDAGHTYKVKVFQRFDDGNLALDKNAVAFSYQDGLPNGSYAATYATDGDEDATRWSSLSSDPQWIYVDLGQNTAFNRVWLKWEAAYSTHFKIQTAPDGVLPQYDGNYTTVYDSGTIADGLTGEDLKMNIVLSSHYTARYVRMYSDARATQKNGQKYGVSLFEFKIFDDNGLSVWGPDYPVYAGSGAQTLEVWSNVTWSATSDQDWLTLRQSTGGSGYSTPYMDSAPNMTGAVRTANLTFTAGTATKVVPVTQPAETRTYNTTTTGGTKITMYLYPGPLATTYGADGTLDADIVVSCNWQWTAEVVNADWLTITSGSSGTGVGSIHVHALPNTSGAIRTALIVLRTGAFPLLADVWVSQQPSAQPDKWSPSGGGGTRLLMIPRTGSWTAASSASSWLTVTPASGNGNASISMAAGANTTGSTRTATVTITGGGATKTIQVTQAGVSLVPSPTAISVAAAGGTKSITITSNTTWWSAYTTNGSDQTGTWLSINTGSYSGSGNGTVSFTVSKNTTGKVRTATITITGGNVPTKTVTITQAK